MKCFRHLFLLICLSTALLFTSCKVNCSVGGSSTTVKARGITYSLPVETSDYSDTPAGFSYKGDSVIASEVGGQLTVDGKKYGALKHGDTVDLTTKGTVMVNGTNRLPQ